MIKPICSRCNKELTNFGAILLSPPDKEGNIKKEHICRGCYEAQGEVLNNLRLEMNLEHDVARAEIKKLDERILELYHHEAENFTLREKLTNMMKAFRPLEKLDEERIRELLCEYWYGAKYDELKTHAQNKVNDFLEDNSEFIEAINCQKFGTAHKPKIDEGKMNGGLRPLGTTGNYTDSMGNLYSKQ